MNRVRVVTLTLNSNSNPSPNGKKASSIQMRPLCKPYFFIFFFCLASLSLVPFIASQPHQWYALRFTCMITTKQARQDKTTFLYARVDARVYRTHQGSVAVCHIVVPHTRFRQPSVALSRCLSLSRSLFSRSQGRHKTRRRLEHSQKRIPDLSIPDVT